MNAKHNGKTVKRVVRTYFVWSEKKEARWFREMSARGWHLKKASPLFYTFENGEPRDLVYQFDFRFGSSGDEAEYLDIFREAGWERVCRVGGWYYFRKDRREGEQNRIYSDRESLRKKYRTLLLLMWIYAIIRISMYMRKGEEDRK